VGSGFQAICGVPLWVSEVVPPRDRGKLSDIHSVMINVGYSIIGYVGVGFYNYDSPNAWRAPLGIAIVPSVIFLTGVWWLPESPRYLIQQNRNEEAWKIIHGLHSDPSDPTDEFAKREFYQIHKQLHFDRTLKTSWADIFRRPSYRKRAIISIMLSYSIMSSGLITIQSNVSSPSSHLPVPNRQQIMALLSTQRWDTPESKLFSCRPATPSLYVSTAWWRLPSSTA